MNVLDISMCPSPTKVQFVPVVKDSSKKYKDIISEYWFVSRHLCCLKIFKIFLLLHISSNYAKILGETNFQPREFPRSGSKAKDRKEKED